MPVYYIRYFRVAGLWRARQGLVLVRTGTSVEMFPANPLLFWLGRNTMVVFPSAFSNLQDRLLGAHVKLVRIVIDRLFHVLDALLCLASI